MATGEITKADIAKAQAEAVQYIRKKYGKGAIMSLTEKSIVAEKDLLSTGSLKLDLALGGGILRGRIIEVYGKPSSGKTTLALHTMASAQKLGRILFVDSEYAFDTKYATNLGVDLSKVDYHPPVVAEEAFEVIEKCVASNAYSLVVVDTVAFLCPRAELEGDSGDANMGKMGKLMAQHLRKVTAISAQSKCVPMYLNQSYSGMSTYGPREIQSGGGALGKIASIRIRINVNKADQIKDKDDKTKIIAVNPHARVEKNKIAAPFKEVDFIINFGKGINRIDEIIDCGVDYGIIEKKGNWFKYGEEKGQGKDGFRSIVEANADKIEKEIRDAFNKL